MATRRRSSSSSADGCSAFRSPRSASAPPGRLVHDRTRLGDAPRRSTGRRSSSICRRSGRDRCARGLLRDTGARVIKVESKTRPDGARNGPAAFFDLMHAGKEFVSIDFTGDALRDLLLEADVVVEGSRPRALEQLGIDAREIVERGPRVWLSITGHGRTNRNATGSASATTPRWPADSWRGGATRRASSAMPSPIRSPASPERRRCSTRCEHGGRWLIDCNLAGVAAYVAAAQ